MNLTVEEWTAREFGENSRPPKATLWRWLRNDQIPGAFRMGKRYYIPSGTRASQLTGNRRVDSM